MKNILKICLSACVALTFYSCDKHYTCPSVNLENDFNSWLPNYKLGDTITYKDSLGNTTIFKVAMEDLTPQTTGTYGYFDKKGQCPLNATMLISGNRFAMAYNASQPDKYIKNISYTIFDQNFAHPLYDPLHEFPNPMYFIHYDTITLINEKFEDVFRLTMPTDIINFENVIYVGRKKGIVAYYDNGKLFALKN